MHDAILWSHDYLVLLIFVLAYCFSALMCFFCGLGKLLHKHIHVIQLEGISKLSLILDVTATGFLYLQQKYLYSDIITSGIDLKILQLLIATSGIYAALT